MPATSRFARTFPRISQVMEMVAAEVGAAAYRALKAAGYKGFLAMEIDYLHEEFRNNWADDDEDKAVAQSVKELKRIANLVG